MKYIWPNFTYSFEKDLVAFQKKNVAQIIMLVTGPYCICVLLFCLLFVLIFAKSY